MCLCAKKSLPKHSPFQKYIRESIRQYLYKNSATMSYGDVNSTAASSLGGTQATLLFLRNQFYLLESIPVFQSGWYSEEQKKVQLN